MTKLSSFGNFALTRADMKTVKGGGSYQCHSSGGYYNYAYGQKIPETVTTSTGTCGLATYGMCMAGSMSNCKAMGLSSCQADCYWCTSC